MALVDMQQTARSLHNPLCQSALLKALQGLHIPLAAKLCGCISAAGPACGLPAGSHNMHPPAVGVAATSRLLPLRSAGMLASDATIGWGPKATGTGGGIRCPRCAKGFQPGASTVGLSQSSISSKGWAMSLALAAPRTCDTPVLLRTWRLGERLT